jgi:hypothetical protein
MRRLLEDRAAIGKPEACLPAVPFAPPRAPESPFGHHAEGIELSAQPRHPDSKRVEIFATYRYPFDSRLLR